MTMWSNQKCPLCGSGMRQSPSTQPGTEISDLRALRKLNDKEAWLAVLGWNDAAESLEDIYTSQKSQ